MDIQKSSSGKLSSIQNALQSLIQKKIVVENAGGKYYINDRFWVLKPDAEIKVDDSLTGLIELQRKIENRGFVDD